MRSAAGPSGGRRMQGRSCGEGDLPGSNISLKPARFLLVGILLLGRPADATVGPAAVETSVAAGFAARNVSRSSMSPALASTLATCIAALDAMMTVATPSAAQARDDALDHVRAACSTSPAHARDRRGTRHARARQQQHLVAANATTTKCKMQSDGPHRNNRNYARQDVKHKTPYAKHQTNNPRHQTSHAKRKTTKHKR